MNAWKTLSHWMPTILLIISIFINGPIGWAIWGIGTGMLIRDWTRKP